MSMHEGDRNPDSVGGSSHPAFWWRAALAAAVVYFVAGGLLALWFPADGLDLYVSYAAGAAARSGHSPYERAVYLEAWSRLAPPGAVAESRVLPFAYPPSWIPIAMALSILPWNAALTSWRLISAASLAASVVLLVHRLYADELDAGDRHAVWCFALTLSPTITVLTIGQSSLVVVFMLVLSAVALASGRRFVSGLALAVAAVKPQLAAAYVLFLLFRRELPVLAVAAAGNAALAGIGLFASGVRIDAYLDAAARWSANNPATGHINVGVASLLGHFTHLDLFAVTAIGLVVGVALVALVAVGPRPGASGRPLGDVLPIVLLAAPLGFRCNAYDLVALIPLFAWARARRTPPVLGALIQALCLVLVLPRAALRLVYERILAGMVSHDVYYVGEVTFRSWVLVLLVPLVLVAWRARAAPPTVLAP